jgi:hypothetical protein
VFREIAGILAGYGTGGVFADEYGSDFVRSLGFDCSVDVWQVASSASDKLERYLALALRIANGDVELPPDEVVRRDLLGLRKVARQGSVQIVLPHTPDGRHADYAPSVVLALHKYVRDPDRAEKAPALGTKEWEDERHLRELAQARRIREAGGVFVDELPPWLDSWGSE